MFWATKGEFEKLKALVEKLRGSMLSFIGSSISRVKFNFTKMDFPNPGVESINNVVNIGFNIAGGGGPEIYGETALAIAFENNFELEGNNYHELHVLFVDKEGKQYRPVTYFLDKNDRSKWTGADMVHSFEFREPINNAAYFRVEERSNGAMLRITNPKTGNGVLLWSSPEDQNFQILPQGTNQQLILRGFDSVAINKLIVEKDGEGNGIYLWGENEGKTLKKIKVGEGLELIGGELRLKK